MNDPAILDLSHHRLNKAKEALRQAELLLQNTGYDCFNFRNWGANYS